MLDNENKVYIMYHRQHRFQLKKINDVTHISFQQLLIKNPRVTEFLFNLLNSSITDVDFFTVKCINVIWDALRCRRQIVILDLSFHFEQIQL